MAFISFSKHNFFLEALDILIKKFEEQNSNELSSNKMVTELKKEKLLLEGIYADFDTTTNQLKKLIKQYQDAQRVTRIKLRRCQKNVYKPIAPKLI
jgi:hypothetical protein